MKTFLICLALAYAALILGSMLYYGWKERRKQLRRDRAKFEAIRVATAPIELSIYSAWGLLYELEVKKGKRNPEYLRMQLRNQS